MLPVHLPVLHISEDPSADRLDSGCFAQLKMELMYISDLSYSEWSICIQSALGGQILSVDYQDSRLRIDELITVLHKWRHHIKHIFLTDKAIRELLPEMCQPRVPFALAQPNKQLQEICVTALRQNIYFPK